jgi:Leucine-rich repeat (LRR) protein
LNNNYIVNVEGLKNLSSLRILDLGDNIIEELHMEELPTSISYLYLFDNIFYDTISLFDFRAKCIKRFHLFSYDPSGLTRS